MLFLDKLLDALILLFGQLNFVEQKIDKQNTPEKLYEKDKQKIDEVLASGDLVRNDQLLDDLLPPPGCEGNSGSGYVAK